MLFFAQPLGCSTGSGNVTVNSKAAGDHPDQKHWQDETKEGASIFAPKNMYCDRGLKMCLAADYGELRCHRLAVIQEEA